MMLISYGLSARIQDNFTVPTYFYRLPVKHCMLNPKFGIPMGDVFKQNNLYELYRSDMRDRRAIDRRGGRSGLEDRRNSQLTI